jgi:REP element-mobilizing transposase RayT
MPLIQRQDGVEAWHHVINRALGRRTFFDTDDQRRYFLSILAREVRDERIAIHAFALLDNHFHLLVESRTGELSAAMQRVQTRYVRSFNRHNDRDGPLVKNRFVSKRVLDLEYRVLLVGYIDWNPVDAGLARKPEEWLYGSAHAYLRGGGHPWLETAWIRTHVANASASGSFDRQAYREMFRPTRRQRRFVDARWTHPALDDPLPRLLRGNADLASRWLTERSSLADGTCSLLPVASESAVRWACRRAVGSGPLRIASHPRLDAAPTLFAGLLRQLCRKTQREVALRANVHRSSIGQILARHTTLLRSDPAYATLAGEVTRRAVQASVRGVKSNRVGVDGVAGITVGGGRTSMEVDDSCRV